MTTTETTDPQTAAQLMPCPNWCDGHLAGAGVWRDWGGLYVQHVGRTDRHLAGSNPGVWTETDRDGAIFIERTDHLDDDGHVEIDETVMGFNVIWIDTAGEVEDMAADLLEVAAKMRGEVR